MSKTITVTIMEGQNKYKEKPLLKESILEETDLQVTAVLFHQVGDALLDTLVKAKLAQGSFCRGISSCGRCKVRFLKGTPLPEASDRKLFSPEELREGWRLACKARPKQDCTLELCQVQEEEMQIVAESLTHPQAERADSACSEETVIGAVDIGTTTIVLQLMEVGSGKIISTVKFMNPQRSYGFDVLSRIEAAKEQGEKMRTQLREAVAKGMSLLLQQAPGENEPALLCVTGNTAMLHIFMGYDTGGLGRSPFLPVSVAGEETELIYEGKSLRTIIMPSVSAFVGADVSAGIVACEMQLTDSVNLLLDLGTNGEMALGNRESIIACATAAGPAFESGIEQGIYGADMLAAIAGLYRQGEIDETGYMEETWRGKLKGKNITVTQETIREIQLAKAAVRGGIELLIKKYPLSSYEGIENVYIAGGFGFFLEADTAIAVGLLPVELKKKVKSVGNTALAGALLYGAAYVQNNSDKLPLYPEKVHSFNLAEENDFQNIYMNHINFPHFTI